MEKRKERPQWWPKNPYPEDIFSMTIEGYKKAIPDPELRTSVSGFLGRMFWELADKCIYDALVQRGILKEK